MKVPVVFASFILTLCALLLPAQRGVSANIIGVPEVSLQIQPAVELIFPSVPGIRYKLFESTDLTNWQEIPGEHEGNGDVISIFQRARPNARVFYRVTAKATNFSIPEIFTGVSKFEIRDASGTQTNVLSILKHGKYSVTGGVEETGTMSSAYRTDKTFGFTATPNIPGNAFLEGLVELEFTGSIEGNFAVTRSDSSKTVGLFTYSEHPAPPDEWNELHGQVLQLYYVGGGGEKFAFISETAVVYEDGLTRGTYTYDEAARRISIRLETGWLFEITLGDTHATVVFNAPTGSQTDTATYILREI